MRIFRLIIDQAEKILDFSRLVMGLVLLAKDSKSGGCPSVYVTDRGSYVVQGDEYVDSAALMDMEQLSPSEAFVEVPERLLHRLSSPGGPIDASSWSSTAVSDGRPTLLAEDSSRDGSVALFASGRGSYLVRGTRVTDAGDLADLVDVLPGEAFVEVPERLLRGVFGLERA
jgi:hypothetical protein